MLTMNDLQAFFKSQGVEYHMTEGNVLHYFYKLEKHNLVLHFACDIDESTYTQVIYGIKLGKKSPVILNLLNDLNDKYRYFRFSIDEDNDLKMLFETPTMYVNSPQIFATMVGLAENILNECYPALQRVSK